eukprot:435948-Hanusia_phi.AAC.2
MGCGLLSCMLDSAARVLHKSMTVGDFVLVNTHLLQVTKRGALKGRGRANSFCASLSPQLSIFSCPAAPSPLSLLHADSGGSGS